MPPRISALGYDGEKLWLMVYMHRGAYATFDPSTSEWTVSHDGGGISYISPAFAQTIGCKPWGQITGFTLTGQRLDMPRCDGVAFDIEKQRFGAPISGVFDIMKFRPANVPRIERAL